MSRTGGANPRRGHPGHTGRIDLLMIDVIMPAMNGRDLTQDVLAIHPDIKTLFISGYTATLIAHHDMLDKGIHFLQKTFTAKELAAKLQETMAKTC